MSVSFPKAINVNFDTLQIKANQIGLKKLHRTTPNNGELTKITKPVSTEYEMAGIINALGEKPVYFENVQGVKLPRCGWAGFFERFDFAVAWHKQRPTSSQTAKRH